MATVAEGGNPAEVKSARIPKAAYYALIVLTLANVLNYLDRQIVSILGQAIKTDLKLDDADLGFLLGTAFAVFYSIVGIAMGRISDALPRKKVMAFGLALWSVMTALGGAATNFATLAAARIGVGVGEAVANPCGHSLVAEMFPPKNRAVAMSVLLSGVFLGMTSAMFIGGTFLTQWQHMCTAVPIAGACSLAAWKAALITVALPGLPLALAVLAIREPVEASRHGKSNAAVILREIAMATPPFTMMSLYAIGGRRALTVNLIFAAALVAVAGGLIWLTGDKAQWAAFALGAYAVVTWGHIQSFNDRPLYKLTFGDPTFLIATGSCALTACFSNAANVWAAPFAMRTYHLPADKIGISLGLVAVGGSLFGVLLGGWLADRWRARDLRAPMGMSAIGLAGQVPCLIAMVSVNNFQLFLAVLFVTGIFSSIWSPSAATMVQDLVIPRMRGAAAASYSLVAIVVSSATGPYWVGKVSTLSGSLTIGLLSMLPLAPVAFFLMWLVARRLRAETAQARRGLAVSAGEPGEAVPA